MRFERDSPRLDEVQRLLRPFWRFFPLSRCERRSCLAPRQNCRRRQARAEGDCKPLAGRIPPKRGIRPRCVRESAKAEQIREGENNRSFPRSIAGHRQIQHLLICIGRRKPLRRNLSPSRDAAHAGLCTARARVLRADGCKALQVRERFGQNNRFGAQAERSPRELAVFAGKRKSLRAGVGDRLKILAPRPLARYAEGVASERCAVSRVPR